MCFLSFDFLHNNSEIGAVVIKLPLLVYCCKLDIFGVKGINVLCADRMKTSVHLWQIDGAI